MIASLSCPSLEWIFLECFLSLELVFTRNTSRSPKVFQYLCWYAFDFIIPSSTSHSRMCNSVPHMYYCCIHALLSVASSDLAEEPSVTASGEGKPIEGASTMFFIGSEVTVRLLILACIPQLYKVILITFVPVNYKPKYKHLYME